MKHLIIGQGEIGKSLQAILNCDIHDIDPLPVKHYDIIHIAIPYSKKFNKIVKDYKKRYTADYVVIHSTVPVGTSEKLGVCHSPVTGVHPHLTESMKTFTKFVSGTGADVIVEEFKTYGIPAVHIENSGNTEAGKLYSLLIYGINVLLEKEIYQYCKDKGLDYDVVYRQFVEMYNQGYSKMGMNHIKMYELTHKDGGIGGHCVLQNSPMLKTDFAKILSTLNKKFVL